MLSIVAKGTFSPNPRPNLLVANARYTGVSKWPYGSEKSVFCAWVEVASIPSGGEEQLHFTAVAHENSAPFAFVAFVLHKLSFRTSLRTGVIGWSRAVRPFYTLPSTISPSPFVCMVHDFARCFTANSITTPHLPWQSIQAHGHHVLPPRDGARSVSQDNVAPAVRRGRVNLRRSYHLISGLRSCGIGPRLPWLVRIRYIAKTGKCPKPVGK